MLLVSRGGNDKMGFGALWDWIGLVSNRQRVIADEAVRNDLMMDNEGYQLPSEVMKFFSNVRSFETETIKSYKMTKREEGGFIYTWILCNRAARKPHTIKF
jgi:hypothetical protein